MNALLDNLLASITLSVLLMVMLVSQHRMVEANIEQSSFYALRRHQTSWLEVVERDLHNAYRFDDTGLSGTDSTFFFRATLNAANTDTVRVRYRLRRAGTQGGVPVYRVDRHERRGGVYVRRGGSFSTLTAFRLDGLTVQRTAVTTATGVAVVRVRFEAATPFALVSARPAAVSRVTWDAVYAPSTRRTRRL